MHGRHAGPWPLAKMIRLMTMHLVHLDDAMRPNNLLIIYKLEPVAATAASYRRTPEVAKLLAEFIVVETRLPQEILVFHSWGILDSRKRIDLTHHLCRFFALVDV
mmetsp:Transcript_28506/g.55428  ORF Transcript_28506/g.55428 Transcript_28506/m.55428 type:complete len:105 (-) Transcript_28506:819-1133(-)